MGQVISQTSLLRSSWKVERGADYIYTIQRKHAFQIQYQYLNSDILMFSELVLVGLGPKSDNVSLFALTMV